MRQLYTYIIAIFKRVIRLYQLRSSGRPVLCVGVQPQRSLRSWAKPKPLVFATSGGLPYCYAHSPRQAIGLPASKRRSAMRSFHTTTPHRPHLRSAQSRSDKRSGYLGEEDIKCRGLGGFLMFSSLIQITYTRLVYTHKELDIRICVGIKQ